MRDLPLVARAAQQAVLLAISPLSLANVARRAQANGTPYTVAPDIRNRRPVFVVILASGEKVSELAFDALTGEPAKD